MVSYLIDGIIPDTKRYFMSPYIVKWYIFR